MRPVFCDVVFDLSRIRNGCGTKQFALTAEQVLDLWDELRQCRSHVRIDDNEISVDHCSASEVRNLLETVEDVIRPHGYMMTDAVRCAQVLDLDLDGRNNEIAGPTDLTGFEESDWEDEEASE